MAKVKIYSTPTCPYCNLAKDFFKQNKIAYEEIDVGKDQKQAEHMVKISGQMGVPVIEVDKEVIVGFNEAKLRKALGLK